jgi:uncharacterized protein (DUF2062 family)
VSLAVEAGRWRRSKRQHRLRELLYQLRIEGDTPARQAAAIALGIFIGCTPLYGLHLALCIVAARWLGLNRVKTYLAAHISTPVLMPFLLFFEVQTGRLVLGHKLLSFSPSQVPQHWHWDAAHLSFWRWSSWLDLVVGSAVLGLVLAAIAGLLTLWLLRRGARPPEVEALIETTAYRYLDAGLLQCEMVRGKLRHDPIYFALLRPGELPASGRLVDLGCGRGIAMALLAAAREGCLDLLGYESTAATVQVARVGLAGRAEVRVADVVAAAIPGGTAAILLIDVLHYLAAADQEALLARAADALAPGGVLLLREADAGRGWRFRATRLTESLMTLLRRDWRQWRRGFHYRPQGEWEALLRARGLAVRGEPMAARTPYANVLVHATRQAPPGA